MRPVLFASNRSFSGKSSMCVGISKLLKEKGYNIGYLKPICTLPEKVGGSYVDEDVRYIMDILGLKDDPSNICPLMFTEQSYDKALSEKISSGQHNYIDNIANALKAISKNKDIVLIESARNFTYGSFAGISARDISKATDAKAILIIKYVDDLVDKTIHFRDYFKDNYGGVIVNMAPFEEKDRINKLVIPAYKKFDLNFLGVVYVNKILSSISIRDMAKHLEGEILCARENIDELVESFMVGAMGHEMALRFFRAKPDKVVITGGDRADIQLAALETNTKCLILTGNFQPSTIVLSRAEELNVQMILVKYDTLTTVGKLNEILGRSNLHEIKKLDQLVKIARDYLDVDKIVEIARG